MRVPAAAAAFSHTCSTCTLKSATLPRGVSPPIAILPNTISRTGPQTQARGGASYRQEAMPPWDPRMALEKKDLPALLYPQVISERTLDKF